IKTKKLLRELEPFGVGKITGAGGKKEGSGYVLFFAEKPQDLQAFCKKKKINNIKFRQSKEGVKKEA
ncbi:hypothetical protein HYW87_00085, partial [Candidatus Roizmanbacteria bacterium]|nr:hypothetical protein [Candidatus Roizmanbacteria bacterium]